MVNITPAGGFANDLISVKAALSNLNVSSLTAAKSGAASSTKSCQPHMAACDSTSAQLTSDTESQLPMLEVEVLRLRPVGWASKVVGRLLHFANQAALLFQAADKGGHLHAPGRGNATNAAPSSARSSCSRASCFRSRAQRSRNSASASPEPKVGSCSRMHSGLNRDPRRFQIARSERGARPARCSRSWSCAAEQRSSATTPSSSWGQGSSSMSSGSPMYIDTRSS
mmetsp:Transcript_94217/g.270130  ORF Transcript_94217/g.270130 Transcript_94217/m.270130 type:complete len:226 (-) Transcript_94217:530-1207(-)